jgi:polysaccharide biosynthesis protein PslG
MPEIGENVRNFMKTIAALIAVLVLAATATHLLSMPETSTTPVIETAAIGNLGFADSDMYGWGPDDVNKGMDVIAASGARNVRVLMPWAGIQPDPDSWNWGQVDLMVDAANARGLGVLGVLNSSPGWAAVPGTLPYAGPPANMATYGDYAAAVAGRYQGRVAAYEVWNEPNAIAFWQTGAQGPDAALFTQLLKTAYPRIKGADPGATVVAGGFAPYIDFFSLSVNPIKFTEQMYAAGAKGSFDALAFHPYLFRAKFSDGDFADSPMNLVNGMRQTMVNNGDGGKRIWATEYGEPTSQVDDATQADYIRDFITTWRGLSFAGPAFIYTTRDRNSASGAPDDTYGVYRSDWTPKAAAAVVQQLA